jgi:hypothetical protein
MPYMGYSRQDRRMLGARVPISAKVVAKMIAAAGTDRVLTVDLHADQIQGFYDIAIDNVYASPVDWTMNTSLPRTLSITSTCASPSLKRSTTTLPSGWSRYCAMDAASFGQAEPENTIMPP